MVARSPSRGRKWAATSPPATADSTSGSIRNAARTGVSPSTSCRYWASMSWSPTRENTPSSTPSTPVVNSRRRNSETSSSGVSSRVCRRANQASSPTPVRRTATATGNGIRLPDPASFSPNASARMPSTDSAALVASHGFGSASRDSGSIRTATGSATSSSGTLIRKTEPHQKCSTSTPPIRGPTAAPTAATALHTPSARPARAGR